MDGGLPEGKEKTFSSVPKKRHGVRLLLTVSLVTQKSSGSFNDIPLKQSLRLNSHKVKIKGRIR
jgi:hypothetical protein